MTNVPGGTRTNTIPVRSSRTSRARVLSPRVITSVPGTGRTWEGKPLDDTRLTPVHAERQLIPSRIALLPTMAPRIDPRFPSGQEFAARCLRHGHGSDERRFQTALLAPTVNVRATSASAGRSLRRAAPARA